MITSPMSKVSWINLWYRHVPSVDKSTKFKISFFTHPRYERKACVLRTDSWKQSFQRKTSFTWPTRKPTNCFALCITKVKRFVITHANFSIYLGRFSKIQKFIYVCSLCVICGYPYIKAYILCMYGQANDKGNKFIKKFGIS